MTHAEDRHKLVMASLNFFKTADQVCSVLDSLEKEYRREDDYCGAPNLHIANVITVTSKDDIESSIIQHIGKHQEQKEAFLKACTLARRNAETFLKYSARCIQYYPARSSNAAFRSAETEVKLILDKLLKQENEVLDFWAQRKKQLDYCQQYILVEHSAKQALKWIREIGLEFVNRKVGQGFGITKEETEKMLKECNEFKVCARETKEKVRLLIQLSDNLIERGHIHASAIKQWVSYVDQNYKDFHIKLDDYKRELEKKLGLKTADRNSDPSIDKKEPIKEIHSDASSISTNSSSSEKQISPINANQTPLIDQEKRKSTKKKEYIMAELLATERTYVNDLKVCIETYLREFDCNQNLLPPAIFGKKYNIFGNIEEIYNFHKK